MMTEKRFRVSDIILLTKPNTICDGDIFLNQKEACNLLNKLSEENEELKSDLDYFQKTYEIEERGLDIVAPMCTIGSPTPSRLELFKENEELKQKISILMKKYNNSMTEDPSTHNHYCNMFMRDLKEVMKNERKPLTSSESEDLMNDFWEKLKPIQEICDKYNIKIEDLPATLEEYIANDNDGYAGYSKCDSCKHTFEVKE